MKTLFTIFTITICSYALCQNKADETQVTNIEQYINKHVENGKFNGNLFIAKGENVLYSNSFGLANRENNIKNEETTKFLIGSITKPFTALGILILEKEGKLKLSDKLSKYFPKFQAADDITIEHLLTHTSGISDYKILPNWKADSKSDLTTPQKTINEMSTQPLLFQPGKSFRYSNVGYILLGLIIEEASGEAFADFIQKKILIPLDLKNTGIINNKDVVMNLASGYTTNPNATLKAEYINYDQPFSSGNMYSSTQDLWKFTQAILQGRLISGEKSKQIFESGEYYGYGWGIRNFDGIVAFGHYGGMNGFIGAITYIPHAEMFICLLTNDDNTPKIRITDDLVAILHNKDIPLPEETKLIKVPNKIRQQILGKYLVKESIVLNVFEENGKLFLQESGQAKHEMFPYENYKYSFELLEFNLFFEKLEKDKTQILKFVGKDTILEAVRIKYTKQ
ncbi:serine hydrolase domain-containing protein [Brumimicrobium mesophilum]|uniref:serine hydrolase domain-containing protein n=1 Tax=Brumimicrobium mesophilum TaxID=392717 RepID=UPI000D1425D5|nr:serine hydrolase domain-containing protein [Brumimicrobium mesophilum]